MILTFNASPLEGRDFVKSIVQKYTEMYIIKYVSKIVKSWHGGIKPIISQMGKRELSVQFRHVRTSQFKVGCLFPMVIGAWAERII